MLVMLHICILLNIFKDRFRIINRTRAKARERGLGCEWIIVWAADRVVLAPTCASDLKINQYFGQRAIAHDQRSTRC